MTINKGLSLVYRTWFLGSEPPWTAGQVALGRMLLVMLVAGSVAACANEQPEECLGGEQCPEGAPCTADQDDRISTACGNGTVERGEEGKVTAGSGSELYRAEIVQVVQLAAGGVHTCVLLDTGAVRCWGSGRSGLLGYGNTETIGDDETPASVGAVPLGGSAIQLAAGDYHTCALLDTGAVRCWGDGGSGMLGYGNREDIGDDETPASAGDVPLGGSAIQLAAGSAHTCALLDSGAVRCWGSGGFGQLGYGNTESIGDDETPASAGDVPLGGSAIQLAAGSSHTCALLESGAVRCWGLGRSGRLGYSNTESIGDDETPASAGEVALGAAATQLAAGYDHTCALFASGAVRCWGYNHAGQLGYGHTEPIGDDETPASAGEVALGAAATQLAAGWEHTCALLASGAVRCWGAGYYGQLGYGNTEPIGDNETPASASDVLLGGAATQLAAGFAHTCALLASGGVRCWGAGSSGQLGYSSRKRIGDDETPASAGDVLIFVEQVVQLAAGVDHTCALLNNGSVRCWGNSGNGRLGYGNTEPIGDDETPASAGDVPLGGIATQLAAGWEHTCALLNNGSVRCWGSGDYGQLGYGNTEPIGDDETPASAGDVPLGGTATQLAAGNYHTCALLDGGSVRCWGWNEDGQLGYGNTGFIGDDETPASAGDVPLGGIATQLAAGHRHTCALLDGGTVRCWGSGGNGQLGYGNTEPIGDDETPASVGDVPLGGSATQLAARWEHTCALLDGGTVRCWGSGDYGQLGYGNTEPIGDDETPASVGDVPLGGSATQLAAGGAHTCALLDGGTVRCWGYGYSGQLGYGNTEPIGDDETPASAGDVPLGGRAIQLAAGGFHTCALLDGGTVRCWGSGYFGQLGYHNTEPIGDNETPASAGDVSIFVVQVVQLAAGWEHTCALLDTGTVRCWGSGGYGQLGYGNTEKIGDDETPASAGDVPLGGSAIQLAAGGNHTCALLDIGTVRCWGYGGSGQLGYGNTEKIGDDETPASVGDVALGGIAIQLAAGGYHTCALLGTGAVRCWGDGGSGQLGYGNTENIGDDETPASVGDVTLGGIAIQLAAGRYHTCALLGTGAVRCWGSGSYGRLGYGNTEDIGDDETPASAGDVVLGGSGIQLAASGNHTCALLGTGAVRCWGSNYVGQLGYGHTENIGDHETPASAGDVVLGGSAIQLAAGGDHTCALLGTGAVRCWGSSYVGQLGYGPTGDIGDHETPASAGDVPIVVGNP